MMTRRNLIRHSLYQLLGASALTLAGTSLANANHDYLSCALFDDGQVKCWGYNSHGNLGLGDNNHRGDSGGEMGASLPYVSLGEPAVEVHTGYISTCAIMQSGQVKCWGYNAHGELGLGDNNHRGDSAGEMGASLPYVNFGTGVTVQQLDMGVHHQCAVMDNGGVKCWGYNSYGNLGYGDTQHRGDNANEMGDSLPYVNLGTNVQGQPHTAQMVAAGYLNSCAVLEDERVKCWGYNNYGQLGHGNNTQRGDNAGEMGNNLAYTDLGTNAQGQPHTIKDIDGGIYHWCALLDNDRVKCWGYGSQGNLGYGNSHHRGDNANEMGDNLPYVDLGTDGQGNPLLVDKLYVGAYHTCALMQDTSTKCWGYEQLGSTGTGQNRTYIGDAANEMGNNLIPVDFGPGLHAVEMDLGHYYGCALLNNSEVKCWGYDIYGQLGLGTNGQHRGDSAGEMGANLPFVDLGNGTITALSAPEPFSIVDDDGDNIDDAIDNCPLVANAAQTDTDGDGLGDACDVCANDATNDADGDGICQDVDNCITVANADQTDNNGDGYGDACVSVNADIDPTATLGNDLVIGENAVIGSFANVGDGATVMGDLGSSASVGAGSVVAAGASLANGVRVGDNVGIGAGTSIGVIARIGDGASIGANVTIGTQGEIGAGAVIPDGVQIGEISGVGDNTQLGAGCVLGNNAKMGANGSTGTDCTLESNTRVGDDFVFGSTVHIESNSTIEPEADFGNGVRIGDYAVVGRNAHLAAGTTLASGAELGENASVGAGSEIRGALGNGVTLGADCFVGNQSSLADNCTFGDRVTTGIFVSLGARCDVGEDSAIYDGVTLGVDGNIGARSTVLFRATIGDNATIGTDTIIDEQNDIGNDFTLGNNSRLWPRSDFENEVTIGANVLIRDSSYLHEGVTIEDDVTIFPETTIGADATIRQGVELGVAICETQVCGQVTIGECSDVNADMDAGSNMPGDCVIDIVVNGASRNWEDGTYATACHDYINPANGYAYSGATGDGRYTIDPDGDGGNAPFDVYCDMTTNGGGWTLVDNDATNGAIFQSRTLGANPDINVTRGALFPVYDWSDSPQLLCKSSTYTGTLPWRTFHVYGNGLNYPYQTSIGGFGAGGYFGYAVDNGNGQAGTGSWLHNTQSRFGSVWIGSGGNSSCSCNYYAPSPSSGLGTYAASSSNTCSTWIR
ncbi:MAG: fibrinogen-like YCDxxxxGGGW domain-containing protein [Bradymonadia bacterium]